MKENELTTVEATALKTMTEDDVNKLIFNALQSADDNISEHINDVINIRAIQFCDGTYTNEEGKRVDTERVVIFDENMKAYHSIATGIVKSAHNIFEVFGDPFTWTEPRPFKIVMAKTKRGQTYLLKAE